MSKPVLHVQTDLFWEDENAVPTVEAAKNVFDVIQHSDEELMRPVVRNFPLMRGSLLMAKLASKKFDYANAVKWLPRFRPNTVSSDAIFVDLAYARHLIYQRNERAFVRPVSPFKEIAGQVFDANRIDNEIRFLQTSKNIQPEDLLCVYAKPQSILKEWRCIFVNNQYVSGSQYMQSGQLAVEKGVPNSVIATATTLSHDDYFANLFNFVIDIGETEDGLKLVEINAFETASFYAADAELIYKTWAGPFV